MSGKRVPFSDEEKMKRKRRDSERKRRDQLTSIQLEHVRTSERKRMEKRRQFMSKAEKDKVKEQDRNRKSCRYTKACKLRNKKDLQEIKNIDKVFARTTPGPKDFYNWTFIEVVRIMTKIYSL